MCLLATTVGHDTIDDDMDFIEEIWSRLRRRYPHCKIVFIPESNLGKEASHLEKYVTDDPLTVTMQESARGWFGVCKTDRVTMEMYAAARTTMAARALYVAEDCIGMPSPAERKAKMAEPGTDAARKLMLGKLRTQLLAYRWAAKSRSAGGLEVQHMLTGKRSRQNDDLCIAFLMVVYWRNRFWLSTKASYAALKDAMGVVSMQTGDPRPAHEAPRGVSQGAALTAIRQAAKR